MHLHPARLGWVAATLLGSTLLIPSALATARSPAAAEPSALGIGLSPRVQTIRSAIVPARRTGLPRLVLGRATFRIVVANRGRADLRNVVVADPAAPACDRTIAHLPQGASTSYGCATRGIGRNATDVVTATADRSASASAAAVIHVRPRTNRQGAVSLRSAGLARRLASARKRKHHAFFPAFTG